MTFEDMNFSSERVYVYNRNNRRLFEETNQGSRWIQIAYKFPFYPIFGKFFFAWSFMSRLIGWYANLSISKRNVRKTIKEAEIDLTEFEVPEGGFKTYSDFFLRSLKPGARDFDRDPDTLISPTDSRLFVIPSTSRADLFQLKQIYWSLSELLNWPEKDCHLFEGGSVAVCRLAPVDYHRIHFPADGELISEVKNQGTYHPVNPIALKAKNNILCKNARQVSLLKLDAFGTCAMVEIGAFAVGSIVRHGHSGSVEKMQEKGYFTLGGSTVVLIFQPGMLHFENDLLENSDKGFETFAKAGEKIGHRVPA